MEVTATVKMKVKVSVFFDYRPTLKAHRTE
jgi:hypothetical protein